MEKKLKFEIPGKIKGKQRPRFGGGVVYTSKDTLNYENWIKHCFLQKKANPNLTKDVPVKIYINCYFDIPKSYTKKKTLGCLDGSVRPTKKPDPDNILKIVCDALNKIAYDDDKQIIYAQIEKFYAKTEKLVVTIEYLEGI